MKNISKNTVNAILALVIFILILPIVALVVAVANTEIESSPKPVVQEVVKSTYEGTLTGFDYVDPTAVQVFVTVKNTGSQVGTRSCTVSVRSESGTYHGFDIFDLDKIQPGAELSFNGYITVVKEGAGYITGGEVKCQ